MRSQIKLSLLSLLACCVFVPPLAWLLLVSPGLFGILFGGGTLLAIFAYIIQIANDGRRRYPMPKPTPPPVPWGIVDGKPVKTVTVHMRPRRRLPPPFSQ